MRNLAGPTIVLASLLVFSAFGQGPAPDAQVCNEDFARNIVEQQAAESRTVAETDKRVRMLIRTADFLWKYDELKAREYFAEAYKVANDRFSEKGFERQDYGSIYVQLPDYRFEVLQAIAKRDGAWARKLTEELLKESEKDQKDRDSRDTGREVNSLMQIALENVKANPDLSWYLFRRLMRMELDFQWFWTVFSVAREDKAFADALYSELLVSHANATPRRVTYLSGYPFARDRMLGYESNSYIALVPELSPNPQLQMRFIDLLLRRSDAYASDPANYGLQAEPNRPREAVYIVTALQELEPIVIQSFPAFLPRLNAARAKAISMLIETDRKSISDREKWKAPFSTSFEERIAELEKADEEGKLTDAIILQTLISGLKKEEQFKQLEPWLEKITDAEGRAKSISYFHVLRSKLATKEKRYVDAQKYASKVMEVDFQALLWYEAAENQLKDINDAAMAYETLADVGRLARRAEDSVGKARVLLGLANLYEKLNHSFAISELSEAVAVANRLKDADLQTRWLLYHIKVKDWAFGASIGTPGYDLEHTFGTVSKNDFSLPLSNAKAIDDKFYRTIAVIAVAKNCIDRPKPKAALNKGLSEAGLAGPSSSPRASSISFSSLTRSFSTRASARCRLCSMLVRFFCTSTSNVSWLRFSISSERRFCALSSSGRNEPTVAKARSNASGRISLSS